MAAEPSPQANRRASSIVCSDSETGRLKLIAKMDLAARSAQGGLGKGSPRLCDIVLTSFDPKDDCHERERRKNEAGVRGFIPFVIATASLLTALPASRALIRNWRE